MNAVWSRVGIQFKYVLAPRLRPGKKRSIINVVRTPDVRKLGMIKNNCLCRYCFYYLRPLNDEARFLSIMVIRADASN